MMDLQQNNLTYETSLKEKTKLNNQIDELDSTLEVLLTMNYYIKQEEQDQVQPDQTCSVLDARQEVAFDAGLFVSHLTRGDEGP